MTAAVRISRIAWSDGAAAPVLRSADVIIPLMPRGAAFGDSDPSEGDLAWQDRASCATADPEAFFPEDGGSTRIPKRICAGCEVRAECLAYALERNERFGIWGGLSERERRRLKREAA